MPRVRCGWGRWCDCRAVHRRRRPPTESRPRRHERAAPRARPVTAAPIESAPPAPVAGDDRLREEVAQLAAIRRELERDPGRALALAEEARARFGAGALEEEREALAILALGKLGRGAELRARGARFLQRFPQGAFAAKVRGLLEHGSP
jgi:hypothetical protein